MSIETPKARPLGTATPVSTGHMDLLASVAEMFSVFLEMGTGGVIPRTRERLLARQLRIVTACLASATPGAIQTVSDLRQHLLLNTPIANPAAVLNELDSLVTGKDPTRLLRMALNSRRTIDDVKVLSRITSSAPRRAYALLRRISSRELTLDDVGGLTIKKMRFLGFTASESECMSRRKDLMKTMGREEAEAAWLELQVSGLLAPVGKGRDGCPPMKACLTGGHRRGASSVPSVWAVVVARSNHGTEDSPAVVVQALKSRLSRHFEGTGRYIHLSIRTVSSSLLTLHALLRSGTEPESVWRRLQIDVVSPNAAAPHVFWTTGPEGHCYRIQANATGRGYKFSRDEFVNRSTPNVHYSVDCEDACIYAALGYSYIEPRDRGGMAILVPRRRRNRKRPSRKQRKRMRKKEAGKPRPASPDAREPAAGTV